MCEPSIAPIRFGRLVRSANIAINVLTSASLCKFYILVTKFIETIQNALYSTASITLNTGPMLEFPWAKQYSPKQELLLEVNNSLIASARIISSFDKEHCFESVLVNF